MAMEENTYTIYNEDELSSIGSGVRKITVRESKKYAYIKGQGEDKLRLKLNVWLNLKENKFKIKPECKDNIHKGCRCVIKKV